MRVALALASGLALAGCNANRPLYPSDSEAMTSPRPVQIVAGCISERFMTQNLSISTTDLTDGRVVMASGDGQVFVRAEVRRATSGSRVALVSDWLLRSTYEPLVRGCL